MLPPRSPGFIAGPKCNPEAWRTLESTFQSGVLRLIEGCDDSSVDMGPRRDVTLAEGVVLVQTLGEVRAGRLVRTIGSFEFVGTDQAYSSKLNRIARKALKGLKYASECTAESLGAYLKSPVFGEAPRLVRISQARGSNQGAR